MYVSPDPTAMQSKISVATQVEENSETLAVFRSLPSALHLSQHVIAFIGMTSMAQRVRMVLAAQACRPCPTRCLSFPFTHLLLTRPALHAHPPTFPLAIKQTCLSTLQLSDEHVQPEGKDSPVRHSIRGTTVHSQRLLVLLPGRRAMLHVSHPIRTTPVGAYSPAASASHTVE